MSEENKTPLIYGAIIGVMNEIDAIGKGRVNKDQHFNFRGVDDVMNELHSTLAKNKVFIVPEVLEENRTIGKTKSGGDMFRTVQKIKYTFYAEDGSSISAVVIGEAMDTADKASNKALSIAFKYVCLQVFCIPTEDEKDPDAVTHQTQSGSFAPRPQCAGGDATPEEKAEIVALTKLLTKTANRFSLATKLKNIRKCAQPSPPDK